MGTTLALQSATVVGFANHPTLPRIIVFSTQGVDVYRASDMQRVAWAAIGNVTCGAANNNGIYVGTSDAGIYRLPLTIADAANGDMTNVFRSLIGNDDIRDIAGHGTALAVAHGSGVTYLPSPSIGQSLSIAGGARCVALDAAHMAWCDTAAVYMRSIPAGGALTEVAPCRWGAANRLRFYDGDLYIACADGVTVADGSTGQVHTDFEEYEPGIPDNWSEHWNTTAGSVTIVDDNGDKKLQLNKTENNRWSVAFDDFGEPSDALFFYRITMGSSTGERGICARGAGSAGAETATILTWYPSGNLLRIRQYNAGALYGVAEVTMTFTPGAAYCIVLAVTGDAGAVQVKAAIWIDGEPPPIGWTIEGTSIYGIASGWAGLTAYSSSSNDVVESAAVWLSSPSDEPDYGATDLGAVVNCMDLLLIAGLLAYGTSDGEGGGRFGVLDISGTPTNKTTVSGDCSAVWVDDALTSVIYNNTHERYRMVAQISPGANAIAVRRDWTFYAEITDALGGIQAGTVALTINGQAVTPTTSAITNGYAVAYTPGSSSGYAERVAIELSGTDADGNTVSRIWSFVAATAPGATVTDSTPPNVVCTRDIGLSTAEADEQVGGVNVIWLEDIAGPLVVTDAQAVAVGTLAIDEVTYHRHIRTMTVMPADANGLPTRDLRTGQVVTMTCPAIGMTAQKCEVLAIQRKIDDQDDITFTLQIAYYEAVT
ncbi:hypothetical protein [Syntrophotalea acetylenica]|uniref:Uncharacterized protein n=1 Tax=Syntrophotalea acetylenica TaxID=29542 RepID=A0A1L3GDT0_SYNAC|nr:hypothetical protein [Syntrophotalea acetylenica]APG24111.1 hypothetical protein A7E75_02985 [Syntrophotalea acetylenica]APG44693.1 hypothetical protein A6070_11610 [Syntrophotalea acetylenica]APG45446.1 hypothetical protein A6070_14800 [Syntrophotalea acetylenica]